ncbi:MAG TPA: hypothetical protein VMO26_06845 [Vicinamibacterales bacterium]|nr:hypothetical protein [Vicinamibacterales bacterium]
MLRGSLRVEEFVNADTLAQGLSAFRPEDVALEAGRIVLRRLDGLESQRKRFAFEATLASHALARRLARLRDSGYRALRRSGERRSPESGVDSRSVGIGRDVRGE